MGTFDRFSQTGKIRVVQAGCGSMAQGWIERTLKHPALELAGIVDIQKEAALKTAAKHGLPSGIVFASLKEALEQAHPDAVFDITVPSAHYEVTMRALDAGCHVLGEKPLSDRLDHAREMCAAADKARRLYMVTQNRRYIGNMVAISHAVSSGLIGSLSSLDADFFIGAHFGGFRDVMDHVLILDMAIHTFDQARMLSGCDPIAVYCHEYNPPGSWYRRDAAAVCIFEMTNGVVFTYRGSWAAEGFGTSWESAWRAVGSKGSIIWDGRNEAKCQVADGLDGFTRPVKDIAIREAPLKHGGHDGVLEEFIGALRTGEAPATACSENIKSLAMCLAAVESATEKRRVSVNWQASSLHTRFIQP